MSDMPNQYSEDVLAYIYAFSLKNGPTKIGRSISVERRKREIERQINCQVVLIDGWPMGYNLAIAAEHYIHWLLRDQHIANEWFDVSAERAVSVIKEALSDNLDPRYIVPAIDIVGKQLKYGQHISTKFPANTKEKIALQLRANETHADFIREAIENELDRREMDHKSQD